MLPEVAAVPSPQLITAWYELAGPGSGSLSVNVATTAAKGTPALGVSGVTPAAVSGLSGPNTLAWLLALAVLPPSSWEVSLSVTVMLTIYVPVAVYL
jgi:hypothetical protein